METEERLACLKSLQIMFTKRFNISPVKLSLLGVAHILLSLFLWSAANAQVSPPPCTDPQQLPVGCLVQHHRSVFGEAPLPSLAGASSVSLNNVDKPFTFVHTQASETQFVRWETFIGYSGECFADQSSKGCERIQFAAQQNCTLIDQTCDYALVSGTPGKIYSVIWYTQYGRECPSCPEGVQTYNDDDYAWNTFTVTLSKGDRQITGRVVGYACRDEPELNCANGGLVGVEVTASLGGRTVKKVRTDAGGSYAIKLAKKGTYIVAAEAKDRELTPMQKRVAVKDSEVTDVNFKESPQQSITITFKNKVSRQNKFLLKKGGTVTFCNNDDHFKYVPYTDDEQNQFEFRLNSGCKSVRLKNASGSLLKVDFFDTLHIHQTSSVFVEP